ncbi:WRKY transcription factor [Quillaja saponaria]|uniref:WRKY transcription factor n=1 Tax=Quillaja saponaria TaxID=32244 RepID=A0AAD7PA30_QUISA|nr:WRKY transcription factor [Quillaja saponaria]
MTNSKTTTTLDSLPNYNSSQVFDSSSYMNFTECLQGSNLVNNSLATAFDLSPSLSEVFSSVEGSHQSRSSADQVGDSGGGRGRETLVSTQNSSEAAWAEEYSGKSIKTSLLQAEDGGESSKKVNNKGKKKGEKKDLKVPRFSFITKSEVDHLEDGYRWRKYGQKAVNNSPYPRSYYRCTTQKCTVKKRVERSFQDPSIVITTYEGQHTHPVPTSLRGNLAPARLFTPSVLTTNSIPLAAGSSFSYDSLFMSHMNSKSGAASINSQNIISNTFHQQQYQLPDNGILQDIVPSMFLN